MKQHNRCLSILVALSTLMCSSLAIADWRLVNDQSSLNFISTKNIHASETHHFKQLKGQLNQQGKLTLDIDLASVETGIAIRNTRMTDKLFKIEKYPLATLTATLPKTVLAMKSGQSATFELPGELTIMASTQSVDVTVQVTKTIEGNYIATSTQPVLINAADYGLQAGVELLQQVAGLSSIGLTVPVSFNLYFVQD